MAEPMFRKRWNFSMSVAIAGFIGAALMQWPLSCVFAALAPLSIGLAWVWMRR